MMGASNKLSPMAGYYVRRLIQSQKALLFKQIENAALSDAMLQDPEAILNHLVTNPVERLQRLNNLEILARAYQQLVADGQHPEHLGNVEKQILTVLGLTTVAVPEAVQTSGMPIVEGNKKQPDLTIAKTIEIIEDLVKCGEYYLGPKISRDYCIGTCPESLKLNGFSFQEKDHKLKVSRPMTDVLQAKEAEDFRIWVKLYIRRCSSIIGGFDALVNPQHLAFCSISRQEI